uniref:RNase H type-1 domain-containing protein n=1 Tax=Nicotiana tabacum TaxID=4097 RepID=A0A1S4DRT1_TOBAC
MGDWVGFMRGLPNTDSLRAELHALWMGLKIALEQGLSPLMIDIDYEHVLKMLKHGNLTHNPIISECRYLMEQLGNPAIDHSYREQNQVADLLAKEGAKKEVFDKTQFFAVPPVFAND